MMQLEPRPDQPVALVTGAARGIGRETCRQLAARGYFVYLTARRLEQARSAAEELAIEGGAVAALELDVARPESVQAAAASIARAPGRLDVLINNAAMNFDFGETAAGADLSTVRATFESNLFGAWQCVQSFLPLLKASANARIVNVSSEAGASFTSPGGMQNMGAVIPAYGLSKVALNALTLKLAANLREAGILVNAVCPGLTATTPEAAAMGGRPIADGAASVVWAATLPENGPSGGFFRDGQPLAW